MKPTGCVAFAPAAGLLMLPVKTSAHGERAAIPQGTDMSYWNADPLLLGMLAVVGALYFAGARRLWRASYPGGGVKTWQAACFWLGWLTLVLALVSPVDAMGGMLFSMHMVQHELMMQVAAPLLVLGRPLSVFVWGLPQGWRRNAGSAVRAAPVRIAWRLVTAPLAAWTIQALALWIWHAPPFFQAGLQDSTVHAFQHASFLFSALLFWWAVLQGRQEQRAITVIYLLMTAIHTGMLGALLVLSAHAWYPSYGAGAAAFNMTLLEDQQLGGLIMWVPGGLVYLVAAIWMMTRLLQGATAGAAAPGRR